jgi:thiazole synthase
MELGIDGVLLNSGVALAKEPVMMAEAMAEACRAGRRTHLAGRIPRKLYGSASSPLEGHFLDPPRRP